VVLSEAEHAAWLSGRKTFAQTAPVARLAAARAK